MQRNLVLTPAKNINFGTGPVFVEHKLLAVRKLP